MVKGGKKEAAAAGVEVTRGLGTSHLLRGVFMVKGGKKEAASSSLLFSDIVSTKLPLRIRSSSSSSPSSKLFITSVAASKLSQLVDLGSDRCAVSESVVTASGGSFEASTTSSGTEGSSTAWTGRASFSPKSSSPSSSG